MDAHNPSSLNISIVTTGRFHLLDLARELNALGHKVAFYSYVPRRRCLQFGLPAKCHRSLLPYVFPLVALLRSAPQALKHRIDAILRTVLDQLVAKQLEPCEVFIGMSGLTLKSAMAAQERYNAKVFLERGSYHILTQKSILEAIPGAKLPMIQQFDIDRELQGYRLADVISVPSHGAERSFIERGTPREKLFRNPYGVDLDMFPPTAVPDLDSRIVVFVGTWSLQKGCDVLWEACRLSNSWRLLHVGALGDALVPESHLFNHIDPVPQWRLVELYAKAHVLVQPSRQEGFGLVQAQALACGLPLVCTERTGGPDLREMLNDSDWVTVVPADDAVALQRGIERAFTKAAQQKGVRDILGPSRPRFSWAEYGKRYSAEIQHRLEQEGDALG